MLNETQLLQNNIQNIAQVVYHLAIKLEQHIHKVLVEDFLDVFAVLK